MAQNPHQALHKNDQSQTMLGFRKRSEKDGYDPWIKAAGDGDRKAFEQLVLALSPRALSVATSIVEDRGLAEDIVQDAMVKLWHMIPRWQSVEHKRNGGSVATWLHRVVTNAAIDVLRKRKTRKEEDITPLTETLPASSQSTNESGTTLNAKDALLASAIQDLPERQRQILSLTYAGGLKNREVAEALGISTKTVEMTLSRARKTLKDRLMQQEAFHDETSHAYT